MTRYQIQMLKSDGCGEYLYFDAEPENAIEVAIETANSRLRQRREQDEFRRHSVFYNPFKPVVTPKVVEYDSEKKATKRGGHRFKLSLSYFEVTFRDGTKRRDEWYVNHYQNKLAPTPTKE